MINININPQQQFGQRFGGCPLGGGSPLGQGGGMGMGGMDPMLRQMGELMLGMADQFLQQQSGGCCKGRGRGMSKSLRDAFDDGKEKDEVKIKQNKGKKGKKVPPDVDFKGDARNLPAILRAANAGGDKK